MNIAHFDIKRTEEFSYYRGSHRRFNLVLKARNLNAGQAKALYAAVEKACVDVLPTKEDSGFGGIEATMKGNPKNPVKNKGGRPKGSKNKPKDVK